MSEDVKTPGEALPEEIKELEQMLEEKKRALAERGEEREHKEVFREAFKEKYSGEFKVAPPAPLPPPPRSPTAKLQDSAARSRREEEIQTLIRVSFEKGVRAAADIAKRENPWLLDELHDRLIDEYYQKLIQSKQISE